MESRQAKPEAASFVRSPATVTGERSRWEDILRWLRVDSGRGFVQGGDVERNTKQRGAIVKVLKEAEGPLTPPEIQQLAEQNCPGLGIATVYRLLKTLQADRSVLLVDIPGTAPRYEDAGRPHHHHFHCRVCGRAFELEHCVPGVEALAPKKFRVEGHDIVLYGSCDKCLEQKASGK